MIYCVSLFLFCLSAPLYFLFSACSLFMNYGEKDFQDLLGNESAIDIDRLCEAARHGVPPKLRSEVWKYLLGVTRPDKGERESIITSTCFSFLFLVFLFSFCLSCLRCLS